MCRMVKFCLGSMIGTIYHEMYRLSSIAGQEEEVLLQYAYCAAPDSVMSSTCSADSLNGSGDLIQYYSLCHMNQKIDLNKQLKKEEQMKVIGLTGDIGCGKSTVARELAKETGVEICDCDRIAWKTYQPHTAVYQQLVLRFGKGIITTSGEIDRAALGRLAFSDKTAQTDLNAIIHPAVMEELQRHINASKEQGTKLLIVEGALLLTSPYVDLNLFDIIIQLKLNRSQQLARLSKEEQRDQKNIEKIIDIQRAMNLYSKPDYIIDASGTVAEVVDRIKEILAKIK